MRRMLTGIMKSNRGRALQLLSMLVLAAGAGAAEVTDLYQSQVAAGGRTPTHQRQAMAAALKEVAVKVSGRTDLDASQLTGVLKNAERYVQSYAYEGGDKTHPLMMRVTFDSVGLNGALRDVGLPVWSSNRPKVLLWMVLDQAGQRRMVTQELDGDLMDQVKTLGKQRGLPLSLPLNDVQDMQAISPADIWGGFMENVKLASDRYHPDILVLAKIHKAGLLWQGDWQIVAVGGTHTQEFTGPDSASVVEPGVAWVTQDIASVYSSTAPLANGTPAGQPLTFKVAHVRNLQDYANLLAYLHKLVVVRGIQVKEVAGDQVTLAVSSDTQVDTVLQTLKAEGRLVEVAAPEINPSAATPAADSALADPLSAMPTAPKSEAEPAMPVTAAHEFEWHG